MAYQTTSHKPRGGDKGPSRAPTVLPEGYLAGGYYRQAPGGERVLDERYIIDYPKAIAQGLSDHDLNKSAQLRKFYDYCIRLRDMMAYQGKSFPALRADLDRLVPFAQYAQKRRRVSDLFVRFVAQNVEAIGDEEEFRAFLKHFEALIAYLPKESR